MQSTLPKLASGAMALAVAIAPVSASTPVHVSSDPQRPALSVSKRTGFKPNPLANVTGPSGCRSDGPYSFIGEPGTYGGDPPNYAGISAGVAAGSGNEACDASTGVLAGGANTVGGDGSSPHSVIAGGIGNGIASQASFVGAGTENIIGNNTAAFSAIVSGYYNTTSANSSFIAAGYSNSIIGANASSGPAAFIGTGNNNQVAGANAGIVTGQANIIAASNSLIGSGSSNEIEAGNSFIGSGSTNIITSGAMDAAIVGGAINDAGSIYSFVGGGEYNNIAGSDSINGEFSVIAGGYDNVIPATGTGKYATIGGGFQNNVSAEYSTIAGGAGNINSGEYAEIGGGFNNTASGIQAAIAGGYGNIASGKNATIPGGTTNTASGANTFAAGTKSTAGFTGDFVWSDYVSGASGVSATAENQFVARAIGGFYLYSSKSLTGVALAPGSGAWSTLSDRSVKTGVEDVDDERILAKLAAMPVSEWSYKAQGTGVRHVGPMAQDFRAAFGLGEDDRHISTVDEEGVALAAIKALRAENAALRDARRADEARLARLEKRLDLLEAAR